eukprot:3238633-Rhodomonas_salina.1
MIGTVHELHSPPHLGWLDSEHPALVLVPVLGPAIARASESERERLSGLETTHSTGISVLALVQA